MELPVPPEAAGERLDAFLAGPLGSRARAQRLIDEGRVTVNGARRPKRHLVRAGAVVVVDEPPERQLPAPGPQAPFAVAWEDEHLLVIDKPAGVVVHPARGNRTGTLAQALSAAGAGAAGGEDPARAGLVHRLDRDTSGLLLVARTQETHRALKAQLSERGIERSYVALVDGRPPARSGTIDAPIGRDRRVRTAVSTDTDAPREARTHFTVERELPAATLLNVTLETGRTHQIRVHLEAIGHPVCGDPEYGRAGAFGLARQFLHAAALAFAHPATGAAVRVESPLPADLAAALGRAEGGPDHRQRDPA
ncbi:MAG: RluA family pseudouridine synthase [Solirubrobacteraceae bacterium MAG38_C4-C5]|nr:RluA family pseudouridine synthase [Candidatus Siliceabacter maunaloa]